MGTVKWSSAMGSTWPHVPVSSASRRRLARWLVGSPLRDGERDLFLETLANTRGNRTVSARLLGVSVRTLRNKITEYSAEGVDVPRHESRAGVADAVMDSTEQAADRVLIRGDAADIAH